MDYSSEALRVHRALKGKLSVESKMSVTTKDDLSIAYTPGVAEPCRAIHANKEDVYTYTMKSNFVAVATNGTAVLGLGNIGPEAAMPVMEGKGLLFKVFGGVDAIPLCLDTTDSDEIIRTIELASPTFGGINLEDIRAPQCFEIERQLIERLDIPVFHDDQHGTAIVVVAGLINALKLIGKEFEACRVVINGVGAAGSAIAEMLLAMQVDDIILCDRKGALTTERTKDSPYKHDLALKTNRNNRVGSLREVMAGADVFIGVSSADLVDEDMIRAMAKDPIVFAMANPNPEIAPKKALAAGARIVGTGRSDYENQVNNVLAFPGIFRGALDVRARRINQEMKLAAARAIAGAVSEAELNSEMILPKAFDRRVGPLVAAAVAEAAVETGSARINLTYEEAYAHALEMMKRKTE